MRAILLAKATRTSIGGLQASMRAIQEPAGAPWRAAQRRTALAPMISRRRRVRSPIFEVAPSFWLSRSFRGSCRKENALAEQVEAGATVHLPLDQLEPSDLPLGLAAAPRRRERRPDRS